MKNAESTKTHFLQPFTNNPKTHQSKRKATRPTFLRLLLLPLFKFKSVVLCLIMWLTCLAWPKVYGRVSLFSTKETRPRRREYKYLPLSLLRLWTISCLVILQTMGHIFNHYRSKVSQIISFLWGCFYIKIKISSKNVQGQQLDTYKRIQAKFFTFKLNDKWGKKWK